MGFEVRLQAIPQTCTLIQLVEAGRIDAESLTFVGTYFRLLQQPGRGAQQFARGDAERARFVHALDAMVAAHPGIENRHCDLNRRFEWLQWLLERAVTNDDQQELAAVAIGGERQVAADARSTGGFPIRCTSAETCELIHLWLSDLTESVLRALYNPERMTEAHLYKWSPTLTEVAFESIARDFANFKSFYAAVVAHSEAVLVVKD